MKHLPAICQQLVQKGLIAGKAGKAKEREKPLQLNAVKGLGKRGKNK